MGQIISIKSHKIGFSWAKSNEYSTYATKLFFNDPESVRAKRFQDCNSMLIHFLTELSLLEHITSELYITATSSIIA